MKISGKFKIGLALFGLLALFATGMAMRRVVLDAQLARYGRALPFNLESALEFRYVRMLFTGQALPVVDLKIQVPEGINVRQTYTIGAEYVYALGARALPDSLTLSERVRWIALGWFCLGIPLLCLWLWGWLRSAWAAGIGGAYYAVSLASVIRSTGQELSHENFALPILIGFLALGALAEARSRNRSFAILALLSAALLAWALTAWDMIQLVVAVWALLHYFRMVGGVYFGEPRRCWKWGLTLLALMAVALANPYLRTHGFAASPAMLLAYGTGAGILLQRLVPAWKKRHRLNTASAPLGAAPDDNGRHPVAAASPPLSGPASVPEWQDWRRRLTLVLLGAAPLVLGGMLAGTYAGAYGHFWELLQAKLMFFNSKPPDPALLSFAQRILWAPALDSATWLLTRILFPATLPLFVLTAIIVCSRARWRSDPEVIHLLWFCGLALPAFILFVRFHVFLIIGLSAWLGWAAYWASTPTVGKPGGDGQPCRRPGLGNIAVRGGLLLLLLAGVGVEAANVLRDPLRWGSDPAYLPQKQELVQWMKENRVEEPVLANFGISAFLLAYTDCAIVLHPKFESPAIRRRVQAYGEALFLADEAGFRDWAEQYGSVWYIHSLGEFAGHRPELQMRYSVNALRPPADAAARLFEYEPDHARYFQLLWSNAKYQVFRIIRRTDENEAERIAADAQGDLERGNLTDAELKATLALLHDPHAARARKILLRIGDLRDKDVKTTRPRSLGGQ